MTFHYKAKSQQYLPTYLALQKVLEEKKKSKPTRLIKPIKTQEINNLPLAKTK